MNKLLITGGTGFWGKNILELILEDANYSVFFEKIIVVTRDSEKFLNQFPQFKNDKIEYINGDIRTIKIDRTDINYILHLATDVSKTDNENNPLSVIDSVVNGLKNILEIAKNQKELKKLIFASSGAVYGKIPNHISHVKEDEQFELDFNEPLNSYGLSKRLAEMMCQIYISQLNMPIIIVRGFAFIGKYLPQDTHFAIGNFEKQAREDRKIVIKSDGSPIRSYMDSKDLASTILKLLTKENTKFHVYNLGSGEGKSLKEWAYWVAERHGSDVRVEILGETLKGFSAGANYVPNVDRLKNELSS